MNSMLWLVLATTFVRASDGLEPKPAACAGALIVAARADLSGREKRLSALAANVRSENTLLIDEVRASIRWSNEGAAPDRRDAFSFASRLQALRPRLTGKQWKKGVGLWADWLERTGQAWEIVDPAEYCGLGDEGRSFVQDLMFTMSVATNNGGGRGDLRASAALGALSLGLDVVAFVPNVAMSFGKKLAKDSHVRSSVRAFRRLVDFVESSETERSPAPAAPLK